MPPGPGNQGQNNSTAQQMLTMLGRQYGTLQQIAGQFANFFATWQAATREHQQAMDDLIDGVHRQGRGGQSSTLSGGGDGLPAVTPQTNTADPAKTILDSVQQIARTTPVLGNALGMIIGAFRQAASAAQQMFAVNLSTRRGMADPDARDDASDRFKYLYDRNDTPGGTRVSTQAVKGDSAMTGLASVGQSLAGIATAASTAIAGLQALAGASAATVSALAPGTVMAFNLAMRDLTATFGVALQPVVQTATTFARMIGSTLLPIMDQLRPVFQELGQVFLNVGQVVLRTFARLADAMMPVVNAFAGVIDALEPVLQVFVQIAEIAMAALMPMFAAVAGLFKLLEAPLRLVGELFQMLSPALESFIVITRGISAAVLEVFNSLADALGLDSLRGGMQEFRGAIEQISRASILAAGTILKMFGFDGAVDAMMKALEPSKRDNTGLAAPQNATVGDLGGYLQTITRAALLAGGGAAKGPEDEQRAWRESVKGDLQKLASFSIDDLAAKVGSAVAQAMIDVANSTASKAVASVDIFGAAAEYAKSLWESNQLDAKIRERGNIPGAGMMPGSL